MNNEEKPTFVSNHKEPVVIKAMSSNTLSDQYRDQITIAYQYIGNSIPEISFDWNGKKFDTPIFAGPVAGYDRMHPEGALAYARAVQRAGSVVWMSFHEPDMWKKILDAGIPALRVIKPLADNDAIIECIKYDTEHGAIGYAVDIDHGMNPYGEFDHQLEAFSSKTEKDLEILADASSLPFYVKGVLTVRDAQIAKSAGADGIVISGHNNRFPCAIPPLKVLPEIRKSVGDDFRIFIDGSLNNGYDAFKALALGADGILCARGLMGAFSKDGEEGLTMKILEMTAELKGAMANTGSTSLQNINRDAVILP